MGTHGQLNAVPMALIEVHTDIYLGEDDIIRYEDIYARG
jgi:mannose-6-phosphate isomerase-like protein (cupin superfamily)